MSITRNVILGNCLEEMPKMAKGSIDMILTDLPYGMTFSKKNAYMGLF